MSDALSDYLSREKISAILDFDKRSDTLVKLDLTSANKVLSQELLADTKAFSDWVNTYISESGGRYGIGGYNEHRAIYNYSSNFNAGQEPRRLHLGTDIWAPVNTKIYSPLSGSIHSFKFNNADSDYGATILIEHQSSSFTFYTLYGHLSLASLNGLFKGKAISSGEEIAELGNFAENGNWPPHLHFQLILDLEGMEGDYPGVCRISEKTRYLQNCPDPDNILRFTFQ